MPRFLHVGCGKKRKDSTVRLFASPDWEEVTLDIDSKVKPDITDKLPELAKVEPGSFDAVYSAHNIEHLYPHEVPLAFQAFRRVLNDDGFVIITCPDLQVIGERLASGDLETPLYTSPAGPVAPLDMLFGFRPSMARGNLYMAHHVGFTLNSLMMSCSQAGFASVAGFRREQFHDLWVVAFKREHDSAGAKELAKTLLIPA